MKHIIIMLYAFNRIVSVLCYIAFNVLWHCKSTISSWFAYFVIRLYFVLDDSSRILSSIRWVFFRPFIAFSIFYHCLFRLLVFFFFIFSVFDFPSPVDNANDDSLTRIAAATAAATTAIIAFPRRQAQ